MGLLTALIDGAASGLNRLAENKGPLDPIITVTATSERRLMKNINYYATMGYQPIEGIHRDKDWAYRCTMQLVSQEGAKNE